MTWHLKDRELEKKLTDLCSYFLEVLNYGVLSKRDDENYILVSFDRDKSGNSLGSNDLWFWIDELEEVQEYNPNAWNEYPKVIPPRHEPLRVEFADKSGTKAFFDDCLREYVTAKRIDRPCRYRPWED